MLNLPQENEAYLAFGPISWKGNHTLNLSPTGDLTEAAANLFKMLRLWIVRTTVELL